MKTINKIFKVLSVVSILGAASAFAQWGVPAEECAFFNAQMEPALKLYHEGKCVEALEEIRRTHQRLREARPGLDYFHNVIWWEAQTKTGQLDEEWGADIFRYLFECRYGDQDPTEIEHLFGGDYCTIGNLVGYLRHIGKAAEARSFVLLIEKDLGENKGMDSQCVGYKDLGPLFNFLPEARQRAFPVRNGDLPGQSGNGFIYYPLLYGIGHAANAAMDSGDWVRAAELYAWFIAYTDAYMEVDDVMRSEITQHTLSYVQSLAQICLMHGYPDEAVTFVERYLDQMNRGWYQVKPQLRLEAQLELAVLNLYRGIQTEGAIDLADMTVEQGQSFLFYDRWDLMDVELKRARIYYADGRKEEAWAFIDAMLDRAQKDHNPYLWTRILVPAIDLAIADGSVRPELEDWFILALKSERLNGNKFAELPLYEKYAQFLASRGRFEEALYMQNEAVRLAHAMSLDSRRAVNERVLAELTQQFAESLAKMETVPVETLVEAPVLVGVEPPVQRTEDLVVVSVEQPGPLAGSSIIALPKNSPAVTLQPRKSITVALPDQPAFGRFYLLNPSDVEQAGSLVLRGSIDTPLEITKMWLTVAADPEFSPNEWMRDLLLAPGACQTIDLIGNPVPDGDELAVECCWVPADNRQVLASATWTYACAETDKRVSVVDAHEIDSNPFYLIPVRHMVQRTTAEKAEVIDIKVSASRPTRIEIYEEASGRLLAIDADGNGSLMDQGDLIAVDRDRNNWPDTTFAVGENRFAVVLYVRPLEEGVDEVELTVQLRVDGVWQTDAIDLIRTDS